MITIISLLPLVTSITVCCVIVLIVEVIFILHDVGKMKHLLFNLLILVSLLLFLELQGFDVLLIVSAVLVLPSAALSNLPKSVLLEEVRLACRF